jgi:hypothetical protein
LAGAPLNSPQDESAVADMTASFMRRVLIETVDEIRHFYQFTVAAQSSYPLSQLRSIIQTETTKWNF